MKTMPFSVAVEQFHSSPNPALARGLLRYARRRPDVHDFLGDTAWQTLRYQAGEADHDAGEEADDGRALAEFYAGLWNAYEDAGLEPTHAAIEKAADELCGGSWVVDQDEDTGRWTVQHADDMQRVHRFDVKHAPKGGVSIGGKFFHGGRFIPAGDYNQATAQQKDAIDHPKQKQAEARRGRGSVDHGKLAELHAPHAGVKLDKAALASTKRSFNALLRHHGDLVVHRLEEIAQDLHKAYNALPEDEEGKRAQFAQRLRGVGHMLEMAKAAGHTGEVKQPEKAAEPEAAKGGVVGREIASAGGAKLKIMDAGEARIGGLKVQNSNGKIFEISRHEKPLNPKNPVDKQHIESIKKMGKSPSEFAHMGEGVFPADLRAQFKQAFQDHDAAVLAMPEGKLADLLRQRGDAFSSGDDGGAFPGSAAWNAGSKATAGLNVIEKQISDHLAAHPELLQGKVESAIREAVGRDKEAGHAKPGKVAMFRVIDGVSQGARGVTEEQVKASLRSMADEGKITIHPASDALGEMVEFGGQASHSPSAESPKPPAPTPVAAKAETPATVAVASDKPAAKQPDAAPAKPAAPPAPAAKPAAPARTPEHDAALKAISDNADHIDSTTEHGVPMAEAARSMAEATGKTFQEATETIQRLASEGKLKTAMGGAYVKAGDGAASQVAKPQASAAQQQLKPSSPSFSGKGSGPASKPFKGGGTMGDAVKGAMEHLTRYTQYEDGLMDLGRIHHEMQKVDPSLTVPEFHAVLQDMRKSRELDLSVINEVSKLGKGDIPIVENAANGSNHYQFAMLRNDKPSAPQAAKPAPPKPTRSQRPGRPYSYAAHISRMRAS